MISDAADVLIILFSFAAFAFLHSFLASNKIKKILAEQYERRVAFYRLIYNLISLFTFYLLYESVPHPILIIYDLPYPFDFIVLVPQFLGIAGIIWSLRYFDVREFLGINQVFRLLNKEYDPSELDEKLTLQIKGPYKICRHPVYFFSIIFLMFRAEMDLFYLTFLVAIIIYFYVGSFYEERKLVEKFGEEYLQYQNSVPRIIPLIFLNKNSGS